MKRNKFLLSIVSTFLVFGAYATSNVAYGESGEHAAHRKEATKGTSKGESDELTRGVPHAITLSNLTNKPVREIEIGFSGKDSRDFHQQNNCGEKLAGEASCTINVTFDPKSPGAKSATMTVHTSAGDKDVYLTGTGI